MWSTGRISSISLSMQKVSRLQTTTVRSVLPDTSTSSPALMPMQVTMPLWCSSREINVPLRRFTAQIAPISEPLSTSDSALLMVTQRTPAT